MSLTKHSKARKLSRASNSGALLLSAALALPGVLPSPVAAQEIVEHPSIRLSFAEYRDYQAGLESRMRVHTPGFWGELPLGKDTELKGGVIYDSMSGASPYYLNSLSGASGKGVRDQRTATNLGITHRFDGMSLGVSTALSDENDYTSKSISPELRFWDDDQNTVWIFGTSLTRDQLTSSFDEDLREQRTTAAIRLAVNQVLSKTEIAQFGITASSGDGYWTDPYKAFDVRPQSREMYAGIARYRKFLVDTGAALQLDGRIYADSWHVVSPSIEAALEWKDKDRSYKPMLRYMYQQRAKFFSGDYPPMTIDEYYTADQRLGSFGSIGIGFRYAQAAPLLGKDVELDATVFGALQDPRLFPGSTHSSRELESFYWGYVMLGLTKTFK